MPQAGMSRRGFLGRAAGLAAAGAGLTIVPRSVLGGPGPTGGTAPSERIATGHVGVGGMGSGHLGAYLGRGDVRVTAVSDVDSGRRENARKRVEDRYGGEMRSGVYKGCAAYNDFRELLDRSDIDVVVTATPDHWHALVGIEAARAGKDIYSEKPLSLTVAAGRAMVAAVRRYDRVLQTGSQERSNPRCRYACELVRNRRIGRLRTVRVNLPANTNNCGPQPVMPVPRGFDYDLWLGPAPWEPYTRMRTHGSFRYLLDYSGGELTDRGAHVSDLALWGAAPFLKGPVRIEAAGRFFTNGLFNTAIEYRIDFDYASGVRITVTSDQPRGVRFTGDEGWVEIAIHGGALSADPPSLLTTEIRPNEVHLHESPGHRDDFLRAVRTRGDVAAPVEEGHRSATFCHLCTIALRLRRRITWDPEREEIVGDEEAARWLDRPKRPPWRL